MYVTTVYTVFFCCCL